MRAILFVLLAVSACAGPPAACRLEKLAELPVQAMGTVPVVTVEINGREAAMVLDTGSDATVLTRAAARRLGVVETGGRSLLAAAGGAAEVGEARVETLSFGGAAGGAVRRGARVLVADAPRPPLDGIVGIDTLVGFELELDVPGRRAALYRARPCAGALPAWEGPVAELPVARQQPGSGHLFVSAVVDGEPLLGMLDSGASRTTISLQAAEEARIKRSALQGLPGTRGQALNASGVVVRTRGFRELRIGRDALAGPVLGIADLPGFAGDLLVGGDYLGTRRVWFSFVLGRVWVGG